MSVRAMLKKTKKFALHKATGFSKLQRKVMKQSGRWQQLKLEREKAAREKLVEKFKEIMDKSIPEASDKTNA